MQSKAKILIVEDSEDMRYLLGEMLDEEGYELFYAEDGQSALKQLKQHHPNLILLDMTLPDISGWDIVAQLRQLPDFQHTPIIALTGHASRSDRDRSLAIGINAHLKKPFEVSTVLNTISQFL